MAVAKNNKLDWLPPGWKIEDKVKNGRKVRCYINVKSSKRLYSKSSVLRYIRKTRMNNQRSRSQLSNGPLTRSSGNMELPLSKEPNDCFDWLPPGWITEVKTRKRGETAGVKYKCYIETSTGNTFYSKPEVSRYLKGKEQSTGSSGIKKSGATGDSLINGSVRPLMHHNPDREQELPQHPKSDDEKSQPSKMRKVIVETVVDEGLPPGWIKEIRIKNSSNGVRRDIFYNDTTTGYVFRSRLEVLRYLETGEISKHAYKRKDGGRNIIQSMQGSPSAATVRSNNTKGKERLEGSSFPNRGDSEVGNTGSDTVLSGNNALLDLGADVDSIPIETQKPEGNENDVVRTDTDSKISERKLMRNRKEMVSSRRSSKRLAGIEIENVTHSVAIERVLRSANKKSAESEIVPSSVSEKAEQSQKAPDVINVGSPEGIVCHYTESAVVPSKNEFVGAEQSKDKEECGKSSSRRKPERNRKERIWPRRSSKLLAGIEVVPVTHSMATKRVLRSTSSKSAKTETIPSSGSEQGEQTKEVPLVSNVGSQEEIVCHYTEPATVPLKNELLEAELIKDKEECGNRSSRSRERKPKRNRKEIVSPHRSSKLLAGIEVEPVAHSKDTQRVLRSASSKSAKTEAMPSLGSEQGEQEAPLVINYPEIVPAASILPEDQATKATSRSNITDQTVMIDFSRNTAGGQMTVEPSRSNVEDHRIKEPPKYSSKERIITDELTTVVESNGREKEQQDSQFSFPWSDPCIEFAYKTLTGALPLDDTLAIHDYVQHQIRTSSNNSKHFTLPDSRPSGFSLNTVPSNSSNSFTFPDPGPPGFSRGGNNRTIPDARPPGFPRNVMPSNSSNNLAFPDARPPGFPRNIVPSNSGSIHAIPDARPPGFPRNIVPSNSSNNHAIPDARPPGFCLNAVPSNHGNNLTLPDSGPPGFSRSSVSPNSGNNLAIPDGTPPGFSRSTIPPNSGNNPALPDARPPGFSWSAVPSNSGYNPALPDARPPGFSWSSVPSNSGYNPPLPDARPPGFSWSSVPSNSGNNAALPDAKPPGFSWSSVPSNSGNNPALPDAKPPGFSWSSAPSNSGNNPALPDAKPPGFSWSSAPSNSGNNPALPDAKPPGFSWSSVPSNSGNNPALPDAKPPGFSWSSVPSNSGNNPPLPDAKPPGFPWSTAPSNSGNNPPLPDTKPPGFSWSSVPSNSDNNPALPNAKPPGFPWSSAPSNSGIGINLNVALPDYGPPGFSEKIAPSSQQQQQIYPADPRTQPADFPLQGTMFSPWNHRN